MNKKAFILRPYPHNINRLKEFLTQNRVAIGWPGMGTLGNCKTRNEIKDILFKNYCYKPRKLGNAAGQVHRFCNEMNNKDYVLVPNGPVVFIGTIESGYKFDQKYDTQDTGYSHYREVKWLFDKQPVEKSALNGRIVASLKGQSTFFECCSDSVQDFITKNPNYIPNRYVNIDLVERYLEKLQTGKLTGINANTFENMVCEILRVQFPTLNRLGTNNSKKGDTDLLADCVGNIKIRIQVKYYDPEKGDVTPGVIDQLAESMDAGDNGLIVTSGVFSKETINYVENIEKNIGLVDGQKIVELLFENLGLYTGEQLRKWGLIL